MNWVGDSILNVSFSVAMMLQAVNNMGPGVQSAQRMIKGLGQTFQDVARQSSRLNPVEGWESKINRAAEAAKRIGKELKASGKQISERGESLQSSGFRNTVEGAGMAAPVFEMVQKAAELEMRKTSMQMSGISAQGVTGLMQQADQYTKWSVFQKTELAEMFQTMRKAGTTEENILRGSEALVQMAELEYIRSNGSVTGTETAKILAQMADRGGILQDPDINRWKDFLEIVNQVTTITTADLPALHESAKYLEPTARLVNWNEKDMMMSQGIAARFGLEGSIAGTDLKDMLERINPYKWFHEGRPSQQLQAMQDLGWLEGAQTHLNKQGRVVFDTPGKSVFLNPDGSYKNMLEIFGQFAKAWEKYKDMPDGISKFAGDAGRVLGEQGQKTALLVARNYPAVTQMLEEAQKVKPIEEQVNDAYIKQFVQNYNAFKGAMANLEIEVGQSILPRIQDWVNGLREWIEAARQFRAVHPDLVSGMLKFLFVLGSLKVAIGIVQIIFGTLMTTFGGAATVFGWLSSGIGGVTIRLLGLRNGFQYFRSLGGGVFESLWKGAQFAWPWLFRLSGWVNRFVVQWLIAAARIGGGWLIAMGPAGWIIAGVTALIAAGIWAWNTNFMGFRDKCIGAWNAIRDWGSRTWSNITGFVGSAIDRVSSFIDRVKEALGLSQRLSFTGPIRGVELNVTHIPFVGGNRSNTHVTNNVNVNVPTTDDANQFVAKLDLPGKYTNNDYNPSYSW